MSFKDLLKKYQTELEDYWHSRMHPVYQSVIIQDGKVGNPIDILNKEFNVPLPFINLYKHHPDDYKAYIAHYFIKNVLKIKYKTDKEQWKKNEYWQTPQQTIELGTGDCEDQTLLWMKIMQLLGVPSYKCMAVGGLVRDFGHCFPVYYSSEENRAVLFDLTYYSVVRMVSARKTFKIPQGDYKALWWCFNWKSAYKKPYWM